MTDLTPTITLAMSRQDGARAAALMVVDGQLLPEHVTNEGADNWGDPGSNLGDAAQGAFPDSRHGLANEVFDLDHWNAFLEGFEAVGQMCLIAGFRKLLITPAPLWRGNPFSL